jgi:hypothetical protein
MVGPDGTFDRRPSIESAPASIPPHHAGRPRRGVGRTDTQLRIEEVCRSQPTRPVAGHQTRRRHQTRLIEDRPQPVRRFHLRGALLERVGDPHGCDVDQRPPRGRPHSSATCRTRFGRACMAISRSVSGRKITTDSRSPVLLNKSVHGGWNETGLRPHPAPLRRSGECGGVVISPRRDPARATNVQLSRARAGQRVHAAAHSSAGQRRGSRPRVSLPNWLRGSISVARSTWLRPQSTAGLREVSRRR